MRGHARPWAARVPRYRTARPCQECGEIILQRGRQKYCSDACQLAARRARHTPADRPETLPCQECGRTLTVGAHGPLPRWCHTCKVRRWRQSRRTR